MVGPGGRRAMPFQFDVMGQALLQRSLLRLAGSAVPGNGRHQVAEKLAFAPIEIVIRFWRRKLLEDR